MTKDDEDKNEENKDGAEEGENKDKDEKNEDGKDKDNSKVKKKPPKKPSKVSSKNPASGKGNLENPLLGQLNELNPSSIISELNNTPVDKLKKIEPLLKSLTENLQGTNLGNYFKSLTSVVGMSGLKSVLKFFPNLASTTFNFLAQLGSLLAVSFGRFGRTMVDLLDVLFNGVKSLLVLMSPVARIIPGGKAVLDAANNGVSTLQSATVDPVDDAADALKTTGKSRLKQLQNAQSRLPV